MLVYLFSIFSLNNLDFYYLQLSVEEKKKQIKSICFYFKLNITLVFDNLLIGKFDKFLILEFPDLNEF